MFHISQLNLGSGKLMFELVQGITVAVHAFDLIALMSECDDPFTQSAACFEDFAFFWQILFEYRMQSVGLDEFQFFGYRFLLPILIPLFFKFWDILLRAHWSSPRQYPCTFFPGSRFSAFPTATP